MTDVQKKLVVGIAGVVLVVLFIIGVMIFKEGMKDEFRKGSMASDYFEVDRALDLKNMCDKNRDGAACLKTARYYLEGKHVEEDRKKAAHYLAKSCSYNDSEGCFHLATFWYDPDESAGSINNKKASKYFGKACDLGNKSGCLKIKEMEGL
jgi:TPR repeat protein